MSKQDKAKLRQAREALEYETRETYYQSIPLFEAIEAIELCGIEIDHEQIPILSGDSGRIAVPAVNADTLLVFSWYRMENSGRFEVNAYLS